MTYRHLLDACKNLPVRVKRGPVRRALIEIVQTPIHVTMTGLDVRICRGMYFSPRNKTARIVEQMGGGHVVVIAREGNNYCWERFVEVKEYMHVLDDADEATDSGDEFDRLLKEFTTAGAMERSSAMNGEIKAFWRALGILCPEPTRQELISARQQQGIEELPDYAIALRLRIPEQYVPYLFEEWYGENFEACCD